MNNILSGIVTDVKFSHLEKAESPMRVTSKEVPSLVTIEGMDT